MEQMCYYIFIYFILLFAFFFFFLLRETLNRQTLIQFYTSAQVHVCTCIIVRSGCIAHGEAYPLCFVHTFFLLILLFPLPHSFLSSFRSLLLYALFLDRPLVNRLSLSPLRATFLSR